MTLITNYTCFTCRVILVAPYVANCTYIRCDSLTVSYESAGTAAVSCYVAAVVKRPHGYCCCCPYCRMYYRCRIVYCYHCCCTATIITSSACLLLLLLLGVYHVLGMNTRLLRRITQWRSHTWTIRPACWHER